jgi:2-methylcitrate synthase/citrate synthase II
VDKEVDREYPGYSPGLEGIIAGTTAICYLNDDTGELLYRGYSVSDLVSASYEEVAYLLIYGKLPNSKEFAQFSSTLAKSRKLPDDVLRIIYRLPSNVHPMDVLRTGVSLLGLFDSTLQDSSNDAKVNRAVRLVAQMPVLLAEFNNHIHGLKGVKLESSMGHAESFLYMLLGKKPDPKLAKIFNVSMVLYAEHELNASTFSARVTASTLTDIYSAVSSAIGTLKGTLHGGANEGVAKMLVDIDDVGSVESWVNAALARKERIMGFGHRIHRKTEDPRSVTIKKYAKELGEYLRKTKWYDICFGLEKKMSAEKKLYPNLDLYSAVIYMLMGIPIELYTPIFVCSRIAGWCAHIIEQQENNRLIRPRSIYTGAKSLRYIPMKERI